MILREIYKYLKFCIPLKVATLRIEMEVTFISASKQATKHSYNPNKWCKWCRWIARLMMLNPSVYIIFTWIYININWELINLEAEVYKMVIRYTARWILDYLTSPLYFIMYIVQCTYTQYTYTYRITCYIHSKYNTASIKWLSD